MVNLHIKNINHLNNYNKKKSKKRQMPKNLSKMHLADKMILKSL
jgi:hypothetical protein